MIEIKCNGKGITVDEMASYLSAEAQRAFREAIQQIIDEPDNAKRNAKYNIFSDVLTSKDRNYVHLEDYPEKVIDEIRHIHLTVKEDGEIKYETDGLVFSTDINVKTSEGKTIDFVAFDAHIIDGKILLSTPDDIYRMWRFFESEDE